MVIGKVDRRVDHGRPSVVEATAQALIEEARRRHRRRLLAWGGAAAGLLAVAVAAAAASSLSSAGGPPAGSGRRHGPQHGASAAPPAARPGGAVATPTALPRHLPGSLDGVACRGTRCVATGTSTAAGSAGQGRILVSADGGTTWSEARSPAGVTDLAGASCATARRCLAVGYVRRGDTAVGLLLVSTDGGSRWTAAQIPAHVPPLTVVTCSSAVSCVAMGGGMTCRSAKDSVTSPRVIRCTATTGGDGALAIALTSIDGGSRWKEARLPVGSAAPTSLSCVAGRWCMAGDPTVAPPTGGLLRASRLLVSTDGGMTWSRVVGPTATIPGGSLALGLSVRAIACTVVARCLVAGVIGGTKWTTSFVTTDGGARWQQAVGWDVVGPVPGPIALACPDATECLGAFNGSMGGTEYLVSADGGASWQAVRPSGPIAPLGGMACGLPSTCVAVGGSSVRPGLRVTRTTDGGLTWSPASVPPAGGSRSSAGAGAGATR